MPSACTPIRLISVLNSQRASYSRKPVAFTIGSDSKGEVFGNNCGFGFGNIQAAWEGVPAAIANAGAKRKAGSRLKRPDFSRGLTPDGATSAPNNLTRRAKHRHIFIVVRIRPASEIRRGLLNQTIHCRAICCRARLTLPQQRAKS